jgi:hypothetical protein
VNTRRRDRENSACAPGQPADEPDPGSTQQIDWSSFRGQTLDYLYFTDGPDEAATRAHIDRFAQETGATVNSGRRLEASWAGHRLVLDLVAGHRLEPAGGTARHPRLSGRG